MLSVVNVLFQCLCYDSSPTVTFSSCRHVCMWPAVLPGWPSMLAKRMSELSVGYISIQADIEWSWPWSWSSSRNFWENNKKRWGSGKYMWPLLLAYIKTVINQIKCEKLHAAHFFCFFLRHQFFVFASHLEGLSILALPSSFPEKCLLLLFLLLLLQSPNMLLKTYKGIFFVHICKQITALSVGWTYTNTHSCRSTMTW